MIVWLAGSPSSTRHPASGGELSAQRPLARSGIDTFAPNLLGYGLSTRFEDGLDDPGNAGLRRCGADGSCAHPEGCDRTHNPPAFPLDQQGSLLLANPLDGGRGPHSSSTRFARTDVWGRDIRQVVDDAVARARPTGGKVTLVGCSLGGVHVGRALYAGNTVVPGAAAMLRKVNRVVFLSSLFGFPTEEVIPPGGFTTFPLAEDPIGRGWGGTEPGNPTGLGRAPPSPRTAGTPTSRVG
ncbi:hypothetical protein [Streptomyces sp. NPDC058664]|uniref:hypothetical protein n=1 Tax=unclassified Streptomyces TaxID=2593676 RepID=UPI00365EA930